MQPGETTPLLNDDEDDVLLPQRLQSPSNISPRDVRLGASPVSVVEDAGTSPQARQPQSPLTTATKMLNDNAPSVNDVIPRMRCFDHDLIAPVLIVASGVMSMFHTVYPEYASLSIIGTTSGTAAAIKGYATLDRVGKTTQSCKQTTDEIIKVCKGLNADFASIKADIATTKAELKADVEDSKAELKAELKAGLEGLKDEMNGKLEGLKFAIRFILQAFQFAIHFILQAFAN